MRIEQNKYVPHLSHKRHIRKRFLQHAVNCHTYTVKSQLSFYIYYNIYIDFFLEANILFKKNTIKEAEQ